MSTKIEWCRSDDGSLGETWNPVRGCSRVSPGCGGAKGQGGCYAERLAIRMSAEGQPYHGLVRSGPQGPRWTGEVAFDAKALAAPLSWRKPRRVFVNSMSDLFHEALTNEQIAAVFGVMAACPQHTFQVLTKRAERMAEWFKWVTRAATENAGGIAAAARARMGALECALIGHAAGDEGAFEKRLGANTDWVWPLPNVWIGVSVEDQKRADERIPHLLRVPAAVRFLSCEPLLEHVDLRLSPPCDCCGVEPKHAGIDWVIVGGESGPGARPFDLAWARAVVGQCREAGVACFMKQLGADPVQSSDDAERFGSIFDLADRKGGDPAEWPEDLRVREWPEVRS